MSTSRSITPESSSTSEASNGGFSNVIVVSERTAALHNTPPSGGVGEPGSLFEWPNLPTSGEMIWNHATLDLKKLVGYNNDLKRNIPLLGLPYPAPTPSRNSISDASNVPSTSNSLDSPESTRSGPTSGSTPEEIESREAEISNKRSSGDPQGDDSEQNPKKRPRTSGNYDVKGSVREALEQSGIISAAEMLGCSYGRYHALGLVVMDAHIWIRWFDRQGAIQSTGIDFIEDLPRFLVFLVAIQRFTLSDWGFDLGLDPSIPRRHLPPKADSTRLGSATTELAINELTIIFNTDVSTKLRHKAFYISGRATNVFEVTSRMVPGVSLVANLYWPDQDRLDEMDITRHLLTAVPHLGNDHPQVFGSRDIDPVGTGRIREELGIRSNSPRSPRSLRILAFERLSTISELSGDSFVVAWVQCIQCHFVAWNNGFQHQDLSFNNIMFRFIDGKPFGVVNDWDLSYAKGKSEPRTDVTATVPFMALDLLRRVSKGMKNSNPIRLYYYALESFLWILFWAVLTVKEKKEIYHEPLVGWWAGDKLQSISSRIEWLAWPELDKASGEWGGQLSLAAELVYWLQSRFNCPDMDETAEKKRELLVGVLEIVGKHLGPNMPNVPPVDGLWIN